MCNDDDYILPEEVALNIKKHLTEYLAKGISQFANGRFIRNLYEDMIMNHAKRVVLVNEPTKRQLQEFVYDDIPINFFC